LDGVPNYLLSADPKNWDFESLAESELEECFFYESGRELPGVRERIERFRKNCDTQTFEALLSLGTDGYASVKGFSPRWKGISPYCPEFPERPFLDIPAQERKRRIKAYQPPDQERLFRAIHFQSDLGKVLANFRAADVRNGIIPSALDEFAIAAFTLDWSSSDKELLSEFANWLVVNRKNLSGVQVSEGRGAGASVRQLKNKLKALGALRLMRKFGWREAGEVSAKHRRNGERLYREQSAWIRARREAIKFLAQMSRKRSA
jgi:hypothetical protein